MTKQRRRQNKKVQAARSRRRHIEYSMNRRERDLKCRCPEGDGDGGENCKVAPFLFSNCRDMLCEVSEDILDFYRRFPGGKNTLVEVRTGSDCICHDQTGRAKSLWSTELIPKGTHICPYVGEVYDRKPRSGHYRFHFGDNYYLDAEHDRYDIGYLYVNQLYDSSIANPPNYGRYANTVYRRNVSTHSNNCMFDVSQDGNNIVWIVATCDIAANQEILVDYSGLEVK